MNLSRLDRSANHQNFLNFSCVPEPVRLCLGDQDSSNFSNFGSIFKFSKLWTTIEKALQNFCSRLLFPIYFCYKIIVSESSIRTNGSDNLVTFVIDRLSYPNLKKKKIVFNDFCLKPLMMFSLVWQCWEAWVGGQTRASEASTKR